MAETLQSKSTQSFVELLKQARVSLAVSTYQAGKLILMREDNNGLNTHFVALEKPMGMALNGPRLSLGSGPWVIDYYNMPAVAPKIKPLDRHDACYLARSIHITGDIDIHEMGYDKQGELWVVNTKMSCLCTLSREHSVVPRWKPPFITGYDLSDRCHLNGLTMKDGEATWVTALGTTDHAGGWRENKAFGGILMEVKTGRMVCEGLSMPHSPRWHNDKLWVLESGAGSLLEIDPQSGEKTLIAEMPGFCRGLDFIGDYALVGLSQVRETAVFAGLPLTQRVAERECGVYIIDTVRKQIAGFVVFTGGVQEIFAVQVIPATFPAVLDVTDPMVRQSYSLPDEALSAVAQPSDAQLKMERAMALFNSNEKQQAADIWLDITDSDPDNLMAHYNRGVALSDIEQWDEALVALNAVVSLQSDHAEAHNSLGHAWAGKLDDDKALYHYDQAIAADQKYATAHFNRGMMLLKQQDYAQGWAGYEWRWEMPSFTPFNCPQSKWAGEDITDKVLLVHTEQGNGDAMQFARFLPMAAARCKRLILVCTEPLRTLFKNVEGVDEVRLAGSFRADLFDVYCPIMSLSGALNIDAESLQVPTPYLSIPDDCSVPRLDSDKNLKVGLVWAGSPTQANNHHRSCPIENMLALSDCPDVTFYSLQMPISQPHRDLLRENNITDLEPELVSYSHTGKLIQQMDLVISVCTSVVHLSGALNVPTWVLLSPVADWRWLKEREDSPWYPSVKVYRQAESNDWTELLNRVRKDLIAL